jgi:16S rRNA pseudouridine516 synthase|tara:strand:- start:300 stop:992 length:693 start_codon:yes stop_codon:yes gene_type:complete
MRLDKYISNATDLSRSQAKRAIKHSLVTIDERIIRDPALKVAANQTVAIEGATIQHAENRYFMLNKPAGVVSVSKDRLHTTALQLVYEHRAEALQIAGRLDIDSTGLLLITDDGGWNHRLTSPRSNCAKLYRVGLMNAIGADYPAVLADGVQLEGEKHRCLPATMQQIDSHHLSLQIAEGKYHQVKRMFAALGNHVVSLHRTQIGAILLDPDLEPGDYRPLTCAEVASIQ